MTSRRDIIIGGSALTALALGQGLRPRGYRRLKPDNIKLSELIPSSFSGWASRDVSDLVAPKVEGSLVSKLYSESVGRIYSNADASAEVMMLFAYGDTQSDDLQLHRPEICYPSFGYKITRAETRPIALMAGLEIPARQLVAVSGGVQEIIVYWARLGDYLPVDRKQQQIDRILMALHGLVGDGVLARLSMISSDPEGAVVTLRSFAKALLRSIDPAHRDVLVGAELASGLGRAGF